MTLGSAFQINLTVLDKENWWTQLITYSYPVTHICIETMARSFSEIQKLLSRAAQPRPPFYRRTPQLRRTDYEAYGMMTHASSRASCNVAPALKPGFPWRHDSILPDRALERNDYSGTFNPTAGDPPILRKLIAARELNIPIWNVMPIPFYKNEWEITLANNFAVAFQFAAIELMRSLFRGQSSFMWILWYYSHRLVNVCALT